MKKLFFPKFFDLEGGLKIKTEYDASLLFTGLNYRAIKFIRICGSGTFLLGAILLKLIKIWNKEVLTAENAVCGNTSIKYNGNHLLEGILMWLGHDEDLSRSAV